MAMVEYTPFKRQIKGQLESFFFAMLVVLWMEQNKSGLALGSELYASYYLPADCIV